MSEVDLMLEANLPICPICITSFNGSLELLKHVFHKHIPPKLPCLECEETCQHDVINQTDENLAVNLVKIDPDDGCDTVEDTDMSDDDKSIVYDLLDEAYENAKNKEAEEIVQHNSFLTVRSDLIGPLQNKDLSQQTENQAIQTPFELIQEYNSGDETESECMEIHSCDLCDTFFNSKLELNSHKEGGHMCEFCNVIYVTVKEKENHLKNAHSFKCPKCDLSFASKELCTDHTKSHLVSHALPKNVIRVMTRHVSALIDKEDEDILVNDPEEDVNYQENNENVDSSNISLVSDRDITQHVWSLMLQNHCVQHQTLKSEKIHDEIINTNVNSQIDKVRCELCDTFFNSYGEYFVHKAGGHKCEFCNVIYKTAKAKENHFKSSHSYKCSKCDLSFISKKLCKDHYKLHGNNSAMSDKQKKEGSHKCEFCDLTFKTTKKRNNHMKSAHSFKCSKCDLSFVSKKLCTDHTKSHLIGDALPQNVIRVMKRHKCDLWHGDNYCGLAFETKKKLEDHQANAPAWSGIVILKTKILKQHCCGIGFDTKEKLQDHKKSHSHKCLECG